MNTTPRAKRETRFRERHVGRRLISISAGAMLVFAGSHSDGQESRPAPNEGEVVQLSPFEIDASDDVGYRSTNSISGTSLNTPLKDIPMSIEVINRQFLDDTGAIDFEESLQYSAGVVLDDYAPGPENGLYGNNGPGVNEQASADVSPSARGGLNSRFSNAVNIRGFNVPFQNRDGFRYGGHIAAYGIVLGGIVDTVNASRFEVVRGPNSLLYGIGVLSGITNLIAKRPLSERAGSASLSFGNFDYRRATFDWTAPLSRDLAGGVLSYRVAAALTHRGHWTDFRESDTQYYVGQLQYTNDRWSIFLEGQYAKQDESGIGDQFVYDNLNQASDTLWRNAYWEKWNWQKDALGMPQTTRITGPDTYDRRREFDVLVNADFTPVENLTLSAGAFFTDVDQETFDMNISTLNNRERDAGFELHGILTTRLFLAERAAAKDPADWTPGEGELAAQAPALRNWFDTFVWTRDPPEKEFQHPSDRRVLTDYRMVRYWWRKAPKNSRTQQYRLRGTYSFESPDLFADARAHHTLLAGFHYIHDKAEFTTGDEIIARNYASYGELAVDDPLIERHIFDPSIIRYQGEPLAMPGLQMRHADVWYKGLYALYQGRLLKDNLGVIAGVRRDEYHAKDLEYDRYDELVYVGEDFPYGPDYDGPPVYGSPATVWWNNPLSDTFGLVPPPAGQSVYSPGPEPESATTATLALNYRVSPSLTVYALRAGGLTPNVGERDGNNDPFPSEETTSTELGVKLDLLDGKVSGTVAVYWIRRENALWNTYFAPAPARWLGHPNPPLGHVPDETSDFDPSRVESGQYSINYGVHKHYFEQDGIELGRVQEIVYDETGQPVGRVSEFPVGLVGLRPEYGYLRYDTLDQPVIDKHGNVHEKSWRYYFEQAFADWERVWNYWFTKPRWLQSSDEFSPLIYLREPASGFSMNPALGGFIEDTTVSYTDEATGFDLQLLYRPTPSWEMVFSYAHTERKADGPFTFAELINPESGFQYGTEYDWWVWTLGREAFGLEEHDDDGDGVVDRVTKEGQNEVLKLGDVPSSSLVGGLEGVSLYRGPEDTFSLFQKYTFLEGALQGLDASLGIIFTGPAQTSIPIGGTYLAQNLYGTPPTPERWTVNLGFSYRWKWGDQRYTARIHIFNLLDDQKGESVVEYADPDGQPVPRRTTLYYHPRNFRATVSVNF